MYVKCMHRLRYFLYVVLLSSLFTLLLYNIASMYWYMSSLMMSNQTLSTKTKAIEDATIFKPKHLPADRKTEVVDVTFTSKYAFRNMKILRSMTRCVRSILRRTTSIVHFHVLLDHPSKHRTIRTMKKVFRETDRPLRVSFYDVDKISEEFRDFIQVMRRYFFTKDVGRYNDDIFFITEIIHLILAIEKVIMIDLDLVFKADIHELYRHFDRFSPSHVMGLANDLQPQYRADFQQYRKENPGTSVGSPRPGKQGFNTGVVLFHLQRMRQSQLYNSLLNDTVIGDLCEKYSFKGYLGHQDFYTLTGMEYPELYYLLDCTWNRQLDTGWNQTISKDIFAMYHKCDGVVKVYHGNGDAFLPEALI